MGWVGEPGSWRQEDEPGQPTAPRPYKPPYEPQPPARPSTRPGWWEAVLDELGRPGGLFQRRFATALVAGVACLLLIDQGPPTGDSFGTGLGLLAGGFLYTFWPLLTGRWWEER